MMLLIHAGPRHKRLRRFNSCRSSFPLLVSRCCYAAVAAFVRANLPVLDNCWYHLRVTLSGPLAWLDYLHRSRAGFLRNGALETTFASLILSLASQPAGSDSCTCHVSSSPLTSLVLSPFSRRPFISRRPDCWWFIKLSVRVTTCSSMGFSHTSFRRLRGFNRTFWA